MNRTALLLALAWLAVPAASLGASPDAPDVSPPERAPRWLPESCRPLLDLEEEAEPPRPPEAHWNLHYRRGWDAIETRDLETAERSLCQALGAARSFGPGDLRFAETLDELGLVSFLRGDYAQAEAMQGAAAAEILLALGPPSEDLTAEQRDLCRSSVATYLTRLGWVFERQGRAGLMEDLERAPYLVLAMGYVPAEAVVSRLDWLISRYLLAEDMAAADWLADLRRRLREGL